MNLNGHNDLNEKLRADFELLHRNLNGKSVLPFHQQQVRAMEEFIKTGFPTQKMEDWRFTPLLSHLKKIYVQHLQPDEPVNTPELSRVILPKSLPVRRLVFINGTFSLQWSTATSVDYVATTLSVAREKHTDLLAKYYGKNLRTDKDAMTALNVAFAQNGAFIYVPKNKIVTDPIHILWLTISSEADTLSHPHHVIIADENASISVIEEERVVGTYESFTNAITEIYLEEAAQLNYYKVQAKGANELHVGTTSVMQQAKSLFNAVTVSLGGKFIRNNLNNQFAGTNAESHFYGLFAAKGNELIDNHTLIDHAVPGCLSNEFYKGILDDQSHGVFNGKIMVRKDAQKTNAFQSNRNILLSEEAVMNIKPQLEIFADDVKCTHGATVGQLDEDALFYLRARGLNEDSAKALLMRAFASDILEKIKIEPLRERLNQQVSKTIGRGLPELISI